MRPFQFFCLKVGRPSASLATVDTTASTLPAEEIGARTDLGQEPHLEESALIPSEYPMSGDPIFLRTPVARLPVELEVSIPVRQFRVRDLLGLVRGLAIESQWNPDEDLPLAAGTVQLAWVEFEVMETRLGVRITRLA